VLTRRDLLTSLASAGGLAALVGASPRWLVELGERVHEHGGARRLTPHEHSTVTAAAERIIPRTDTPGATDARVADFVDVIVAEWYSPAERDRFVSGLAELNARAQRAHARSFPESSESQQIAILGDFDAQFATLRQTSARAADEHWFGMLKFLTVWGFYTSRVGMIEELKLQLNTGRYDGNARV
jgi:hypothetical protein